MIQSAVVSPVGSLVAQLFATLDAGGVDFLVLRNYEGLPDTPGRDLDLLVREEDVPRYAALLVRCARRLGWEVVRVHRRYGYLQIYLMDVEQASGLLFGIDAFSPQHWWGMEWLPHEEAFASTVTYRRFRVLRPGHEALDLVVKDALAVGHLRTKYGERILALRGRDPEGFAGAAGRAFGQALARDLERAVSSGDWDAVDRMVPRLRRALVTRSWRSQPLAMMHKTLRFFWGHAADRVAQRGIFLSLLGPDGSGKTTITDLVKNDGAFRQLGKVVYCHGNFALVPELKRLRGLVPAFTRREAASGPGQRSAATRHSVTGATARVLYYSLDYLLGHALIWRARCEGSVLVADRYFYDYFLQASFLMAPRWVLRLLMRLIPTPDLVVFCEAEAVAIHARKPELAVQEIERQQAVCRQLVASLPNTTTLDTGAALDQTRAGLQRLIAEALCRQSLRRLPGKGSADGRISQPSTLTGGV